MRAWLIHNLHSLRTAFDRLTGTPLASLFTILVIGIALSLPTGLYLALVNLQKLSGVVNTDTEITLFLKIDTNPDQARTLANTLQKRPDIRAVRFIDREDGLRQLQESGLGDIAAGLPGNPLPHTLLVAPREQGTAELEGLATELAKLPQVDRVNLDAEWAHRLSALMGLGRDVVVMLAVLLGLALAAITGNTIRLQIYAQRDEIEVARLIGATDRFIRRSFLYFGAIQGLFGGIAAWLLISMATLLMQDSVSRLAASYGSSFLITGLGWQEIGILLATSTLLGLLGAYLAVGHTLRSLHIP
ncbi:MAG: permease-like cell division protein FtsX [Thiobacillaceae bacterium]